MYATKQTHRCGEQTRSTSGEKQIERGITVDKIKKQTFMYRIKKQHGYIIQHGELKLLFCNNFKESIVHKILNYYVVYLKLI